MSVGSKLVLCIMLYESMVFSSFSTVNTTSCSMFIFFNALAHAPIPANNSITLSFLIIKTSPYEKLDSCSIPDCDIVFYSPPCQAFSVAGRQDGFGDPRGTLFFDAFKVIQDKKPKYAIMENVKGLVGKKFQFEFETMLQLLEQEGYKNHWKVLNAKDYGIPQNRERVFIVSIREDIEQEFEFPKACDSGVRLKDILEDEVDEKYFIDAEKVEKLLMDIQDKVEHGTMLDVSQWRREGVPRIYNNISCTLNSRDYKEPRMIVEIRPCLTPDRVNKRQNGRRFKEDGEPSFTVNTQDRHGILQVGLLDIRGNEQIRRVYDPEGIAPTLNTMQGGNRQPKIIIIKREERYYYIFIRKLTPLECFRLMGFEDEDYNKLKNSKVSNSQIYKMAGNSIVVDTVEAILGELLITERSKTNIYA